MSDVEIIDAAQTIEDYAVEAVDTLREMLASEWLVCLLIQLAKDRATSIGAKEYGNAAYFKTISALIREIQEEISDAIFYAAVACHIEENS